MTDQPRRIKALDISVVNRIAAGEIIISPSNALKEVLENSIDAKSTSIDVLVKEGGLKLLQITDNGTGIAKDDLGILCERFTTSKLQTFDDLETIATYGFRGEALASISHIAHLSVTTKTRDSPCAWRCAYVDGAMVPLKPKTTAEPKPVAGKDGTQITVEDLFYNVPSRLRSLKSANEEYSKIVDVVGRYAIHTDGVGFSCKKMGDTFSAITTRATSSKKEKIRTVFGASIANELISVELEQNEEFGLLKCFGEVTNCNYANKKAIQPVFFINNRLVSCDPLKRAINAMYAAFLPKHTKPFVYLALEIKPHNVDVNVHPTKREVRFLHEDEIIKHIVSKLQESLGNLDSSRNYFTQQVLPSAKKLAAEDEEQRFIPPATSYTAKVYDYNLVRTDESQPKITSYVTKHELTNEEEGLPSKKARTIELPAKQEPVEEEASNENDVNERENNESRAGDDIMAMEGDKHESEQEEEEEEEDEDVDVLDDDLGRVTKITSNHHKYLLSDHEKEEGEEDASEEEQVEDNFNHSYKKREKVDVRLSSILQLRELVEENVHEKLTELLAKHSYVGIVDQERRLAAIQHDVRLYLVDYAAVAFELFYQIGLSDFSNFGRIYLDKNGLSIKLLLAAIFEDERISSKNDSKSVDEILQSFINMREMFEEYFAMEIDISDETDPRLITIPLLLEKYIPPLSKLPYLLYRIGNSVKWDNEMEALDGILKQIALFYIPESKSGKISESDMEVFEHVLFPAIKRRLLAPKHLLADVVEIASLPGLYKVFERC